MKLNVLYLNQTEKATQEDIDNSLVYWAKIFKATDWSELKKLCSENDTFKEVAQVMYKSNIQSQEKTYMEAHEKYMLDKRSLEHGIRLRDEALGKKEEEIALLNVEVSSLTAENSSLTAEVSTLTTKNSSLTKKNDKLLTLLKQNGVSEEEITSFLNE